MAIHVYIHLVVIYPIGFVSLVLRPLGTRLGSPDIFIFSNVTTSQGRWKTFRGGAATSKKHAFDRKEAEKFISASRGYHPNA